jgi:hypothetical protein
MPDIFDASAHRQPRETEKNLADESNPDTSQAVMTETPDQKPKSQKNVDDYSETMRREKPSNNIFKSFVPKPENVFFDSQHREEKVLLLLRRHPITQVPWIVISIIMFLLPSIFVSVGILDFLPPNFVFAVRVGWYLLVLGYVLESYLTWFYNVFIITDERVIDVVILPRLCRG